MESSEAEEYFSHLAIAKYFPVVNLDTKPILLKTGSSDFLNKVLTFKLLQTFIHKLMDAGTNLPTLLRGQVFFKEKEINITKTLSEQINAGYDTKKSVRFFR